MYLFKVFFKILLFSLFMQFLYAEGGSNDPEITITPFNISKNEGDSGTKTLNFTVSIDECPDTQEIKIKYETQNGSASSGSDYISASGEITFSTSSLFGWIECTKSYDISVEIKGDTDIESDENFYIRLSDNGTNSYQNFHFGHDTANINIKNDDEANDNTDLSITKTNNKGNKKVKIGEVVTYTIVATNNGPQSTKIVVTDDIPDEMDFVSVSDNSNNFSCNYHLSSHSIECNGNRVFKSGKSVAIEVKLKLKNNYSHRVINSARVEPSSDSNIEESDEDNNEATSDIYVAKSDLRIDKLTKNKYNDNYSKLGKKYKKGDIVKFKLTFGNYGDQPSKLKLIDKLPSSLKVKKVFFSGSKPDNFTCSKSDIFNKVVCQGGHIFNKNETYTIYITAKAKKKGRIVNRARVESVDDIEESDSGNNYTQSKVDVGINSNSEEMEVSKTIVNEKSTYYVGDKVKFYIKGINRGFKAKTKIRDWVSGTGTTEGIFEFVKVEPGSTNNLRCYTVDNDSIVVCQSIGKISKNENFDAYITYKIKNVPDDNQACNMAHFYKEYDTSDGKEFIWNNSAEKCFEVKKPKSRPILDADTFYVRLNQQDSIDLKDYTTDEDTPKDKLKYTIVSGSLPNGYSMSGDGTISGTYTNSSGTFPKTFNVRVKVVDDDGLSSEDDFTIIVQATDITANDNIYEIPINQTLNGNLITDSGSSYEADIGENLIVTNIEPNDSKLTWSDNGNFQFRAPNRVGNYQYTYHIKDKYGQTDYALLKIRVYKPNIKARDDIFKVAKNTPLYANLFSNNGNGLDIGDDIKVVNHTNPLHGTITLKEDGTITYNPNANFSGEDRFTYTIKDKYNQEDTATVYLEVGTLYTSNYVEFTLVNPPETRNLVGNFITIGNSVECITDKKGESGESDSYSGECVNNRDKANNDYMVKYIDVDGSNTTLGQMTWNSSSSNFTLPSSMLDGNNSIVWAGLFWQGSINNRVGFKQRRADVIYGSPYGYHEITTEEPITLSETNANKVLVRIDNANSYTQVEADTFYNDLAHEDKGGYYAAYANITTLLQNANLSKGNHKFTVANILTNEGREADVGNYGGWSLVIIYKEGYSGKPRNISIYNGYQAIGKGGNTNISQKEIKISGFRLPKYGDVDAKISAFVGEGEKKYGGSSVVYDKMYIKDIYTNSTFDMPSNDPNNIFDATIENIEREAVNNNNIENTDGIDVDTYNVSNIMKSIRDNKKDADSVAIGIISEDTDTSDGDQSDYITASMIAFSTELYAPKICYDYDIKLGNYIDINSIDRNFSVNSYANNPLQLKILIKSQEADFDLIESKLSAIFEPINYFKYRINSSKTSKPNTNSYHDAIDTDSNIGQIAIGSSANINGGKIGAKELIYSKLYYDFLQDSFNGKFDINLNAKISFDGINKVPYNMSTSAPKDSIFHIDRCDNNPTYDPIYGMFNIERGDSTFSQNQEDRYSLYTQVAGVPYEVSVAAYKKDDNGKYTQEATSNSIVELELIDGSNFDNNSSAGFDAVCQDPDSYNKGVFVDFGGKSRVKVKIPQDYSTYPTNLALKNAAFRVWVLTVKDSNGTQVLATYPNDPMSMRSTMWSMSPFDRNTLNYNYFRAVYYLNYFNNPNIEDHCYSSCSPVSNPDPTSNICYECLRKNYGMPICSRDNFAIRPNSYSISISDSNQTNIRNSQKIAINDNTPAKNLAAGYIYKLDINASKYGSRSFVEGYYFKNLEGNTSKKSAVAYFLQTNGSSCVDKSNNKLNISINNGQTLGLVDINSSLVENGFIVNNVGKYAMQIKDEEWTEVDQKGYKYKPFPNHKDCIPNDTNAYSSSLNKKRGCLTATGIGVDTLPNLPVTLHPYKFDIDSINTDSVPHNGADYVYIANIDRIKNLLPTNEIMALNIGGNIKAKGKNNSLLTNYTNGCMANDTRVNIKYNTDKNSTIQSSLGHSVAMQYYLYSKNIDNWLSVSANKVNSVNINGDFNITFNKRYFENNGTGLYNQYLNFERKFNEPINPFDITIKDFSINSPNEVLYADLKTNYIPNGYKDFNVTKTFYYAKVKPKEDDYGAIYSDSVNTPIGIALFCNEPDINICAKYGIATSNDALTNEYDWWLAVNHDSQYDGKALVEVSTQKDTYAQQKVSINPITIENFNRGIDNNVTVSKLNIQNSDYPYEFFIKPTNSMVDKYPYLLFNSGGVDSVPDYIEKGVFLLDNSAWSGKGKTGHATDYNSTGRETNKVDW